MKTLASCIERLEAAGLLDSFRGRPDTTIDLLTADSREVGPTDGFVAIRGSSTDGHLFIDKAVSNGATAIVCEAARMDASIRPVLARETKTERDAREGSPAVIEVTDSRKAWVELASLLSDDPGIHLTLAAVTGTNGKTTVATLLHHVLLHAGKTCGLMGTTGIFDGQTHHEATHTTPSPDCYFQHLGAMHANGCSHAALEASSHALDQHRIRIQDIDLALFTNFTRDHLDYHGTEDAYFAAKKRLFDDLSSNAIAVTNLDDPKGRSIVADCVARTMTIGKAEAHPEAEITWRILDESIEGLELMIDGDRRRYQLAGAYNAFNLAAALAGAIALGVPRSEALDLLAACPPVRGRFEHLQSPDGRTVIIDYAHTPDALENVLTTVRASISKETTLWCLFGCGGDRDRGKRPEMGAIAEAGADRVIVTSDNPRSEDPAAILEDIRQGVRSTSAMNWIEDRREAIQFAAANMAAGDTLVLAGKGHETTQTLADQTIHFDDREEARRAFGITQPDTHAD